MNAKPAGGGALRAGCGWVAVLALLLAALPVRAADAVQSEVPEELWDRPRSGSTLLAVPAVKLTLTALAADPRSRLTIRHAPGSEPAGQAEELKAWLVAHAIAPERISLQPDRTARQPIRLDVMAP